MPILSKQLRRDLETAIKQAREIAESAAAEALARMAVADANPPPHLTGDNRSLRRRLRAHGRTLGDTRDAAGLMTTARLQDATAYEIWHRMLFGRFLVERGLLIHPDFGAAISLAELRDLAQEEGETDEWALAEQYAAPGLPGVFKPDDPVLELPIAPEFSKRLRTVLSSLPGEVFTADDSLGWTYQFWRASEKDLVNAAGGKIGAVELPAVTQLFTESYMVKFLLHNTLGAWWAGKVLALDPGLARDAADEDALRKACGLSGVGWEFLRFLRDNDGKGPWRPAAGTFPGWPSHAAAITYCDPCCGSGHFLVEAFFILAALRRHEEGLSVGDAAVAVLRDNLHGLEIDGRCVQIAAFNVALAAWKLAGAAIPLPSPHIAWVGAPPPMSRTEMAALANSDASLRCALETLHDQFVQAPLLGSLLEVGARDLLDVDLRERSEVVLEKLRLAEPERAEGALAARGLLDASALLSRRFVLLATNVPFLGRGKQELALAAYILRRMPEAKADLATAMLQRMRAMVMSYGTIAVVTPQSWLFLAGYQMLRLDLLTSASLSMVAGLGPHAFETITGEVVNIGLIVLRNAPSVGETAFAGIDANGGDDPKAKTAILQSDAPRILNQQKQRMDTASRISLRDVSFEGDLIRQYASVLVGLTTGDAPKFIRKFWEWRRRDRKWEFFQTTVAKTQDFGGMTDSLLWEDENGELSRFAASVKHLNHIAQNWRRGKPSWGHRGISVSMMGDLEASIYTGERYDSNCCAIVPNSERHLSAFWAYCNSPQFRSDIRGANTNMKIEVGTILSSRIDIGYWEEVANEKCPVGLPEPYSDDPTQWLFHGHPAHAAPGTELHVALARVAGYRWPAEADTTIRLSDIAKERIVAVSSLPSGDPDGLLPLNASGNHLGLADRLRQLLAAAFGAPLSPVHEQNLIRAADAKLDKKDARDATLESWLTERAFRQHCTLFHQRPFLWQVWDGMKAGFSAFLHYHRMDRAALDKLTYTLLGDWIRSAKDEGNTSRLERGEQLQQMLKKIIDGEKPFDIFVRWKSPAQQPIGWEPDLDDGVRLNIRPFITAGILREQPRGISWNKDRGTEMATSPWYDLGVAYGGKRGDRVNDHHLTLAEKRTARSSL